MEGQGRLWNVWKIQKRQKRARALMTRDGCGVPRGVVDEHLSQSVSQTVSQSVQFV